MKMAGSQRGSSLQEVLVSGALFSLLSAALFAGAISLQKSLSAAENFAEAKSAQTRLSDYLAMDLRRALKVTTGTDGIIATIAIPDYYNPTTGQPWTPKVVDHKVCYNAPDAYSTVVYSQQGSSIFRKVGSAAAVEIASNVEDFRISLQDLGKVVETQITFTPRFRWSSGADASTGSAIYNTTLLRNTRKDLP